jgi:hypothetical protein
MAHPSGHSGRHRKDTEDDKEISLKPIGESATARTASVESALTAVGESLKATPKGVPAKNLFQRMRDALANWGELVDQQRWADLTQAIGAMLNDVDTTTANIGHMADLQLLGRLRERLQALQGAVATAG